MNVAEPNCSPRHSRKMSALVILLFLVALTPASGQAYMGANIRLGETTDVRAVIEQSDGTLLAVKREVKVTVGGCGG